jgi:RNA polymerase Rpb2, domain 6/RNA polymerase Rpb2, domain 7
VILNKSAIDRGLFASTFYRTYKEQCNKNHSNGEEEFFNKPSPSNTKGMKPFNYEKLRDDGFVPENAFVDDGDIIIGKCMPQKQDSVITYKDTSIALKHNESGFIDKNSHDDNYFTNVNGDGYSFCKVRMRNMRIPTIGDKFCLVPDTEVLTLAGWKPIVKVTYEDKVAQLDPETNAIEYVHPVGVYSFDHLGELYSLDTKQVSIQATMEHRMYVAECTPGPRSREFELLEASSIIDRDVFFRKKGCYTAETVEWYELSDSVRVPMNEWLFVVGLFCADGWMESDCDDRWHMSICVGNQAAALKLENAMEFLGVSADLVSMDTGEWRFYNPALVGYFGDFYKKPALPAFALALGREQTNHLLEGMFASNNKSFTTNYKQVADDIQRVIIHAGMASSMEYDARYEAYTITLEHCDPFVPAGSADVMRYAGKVYCIEVPSHVFMMRHRGKPVWTGNSSRHGQKGTVGMIYRQEDMPFTKDGIVPDIIMNPHAVPSRMTIAQLMECLLGKACAIEGTYGNATPFTELTIEDIADVLQKNGIERYGNEILYNPQTGEQMNTLIFIGPTFYQRLKHIVADKLHSRSANGPVVALTRQPAEGRARSGGLRLGEMEINSQLAHGIATFHKERFMEMSDNFRVFVCKKCGMMANVNPEKNIFSCKACRNSNMFAQVRLPYSCKLLFQELGSMSLGVRFLTS